MQDIYFVSCLISGFQKTEGQMLEPTLCLYVIDFNSSGAVPFNINVLDSKRERFKSLWIVG